MSLFVLTGNQSVLRVIAGDMVGTTVSYLPSLTIMIDERMNERMNEWNSNRVAEQKLKIDADSYSASTPLLVNRILEKTNSRF